MNPMLAKLVAAKSKMPASMPAAEAADIILTLLFWRLMSDWVSGKAIRFHHCYQKPSTEIARIMRNLAKAAILPRWCS